MYTLMFISIICMRHTFIGFASRRNANWQFNWRLAEKLDISGDEMHYKYEIWTNIVVVFNPATWQRSKCAVGALSTQMVEMALFEGILVVLVTTLSKNGSGLQGPAMRMEGSRCNVIKVEGPGWTKKKIKGSRWTVISVGLGRQIDNFEAFRRVSWPNSNSLDRWAEPLGQKEWANAPRRDNLLTQNGKTHWLQDVILHIVTLYASAYHKNRI